MGRRRFLSLGSERGATLTEVMIAASIATIGLAIFMGALVSAQQLMSQQSVRSTNNDQVRLAVVQMDRQIRSGNLLYQPEDGGYSLRVYTQSNRWFRCVQWRVTTDQQLQTRSWKPSSIVATPPYDATPWLTVADHVVNRDVSVPAFTLQGTGPVGRTLNVSVVVNESLARNPGGTVRIDESLTGRNTTRGFLPSECPLPD